MPDRYSSFPAVPFGPAGAFFAITPNDGAALAYVTTGLYVGGGGDVAVADPVTSSPVTFKAVPAGSILPIRTVRVLATGTTATFIVGLA
ncbi:hypothetical protein NDN16_15640 [Aureimonas altamirensis]|uniref:spike base protein, RCAP_Rcc01079 family n=1 Tax=Aureimonas altamirensis TaxID=370622 RepID=UPI00203726A1|nr:hypothetical protein [Aureimonas altamirensis]MCM2505103.1 hypothetical protein [Aureimonas altamirensis]